MATNQGPIVLVRHAAAVVSADDPPRAWPLTDAGRRAAAELGTGLAARVTALDVVVSSAERKAIDTAAAVAGGRRLVDDRLGEVRKPWYPNADDHRADVLRYLRGSGLPDWEPQADAVARFDAVVEQHDQGTVALVTHGTVMSLWLASRGVVDPAAFWLDLRFPDAHVVHRDTTTDRWTVERVDGPHDDHPDRHRGA